MYATRQEIETSCLEPSEYFHCADWDHMRLLQTALGNCKLQLTDLTVWNLQDQLSKHWPLQVGAFQDRVLTPGHVDVAIPSLGRLRLKLQYLIHTQDYSLPAWISTPENLEELTIVQHKLPTKDSYGTRLRVQHHYTPIGDFIWSTPSVLWLSPRTIGSIDIPELFSGVKFPKLRSLDITRVRTSTRSLEEFILAHLDTLKRRTSLIPRFCRTTGTSSGRIGRLNAI